MTMISEFDYPLPQALIAQSPLQARSASRLLIVPGAPAPLIDGRFTDILSRIHPGDLLVVNDTRVLPARLRGKKAITGGQFELLVERLRGGAQALVQIRSSKAPPLGTLLETTGGARLQVTGREGAFFTVKRVDADSFEALLDAEGAVPLPPYIRRSAGEDDAERYQTVYARSPGAVAAPTAGLHFDQTLLDTLITKGVSLARLTLHVGAGTFQPIQTESLAAHQMHAESFCVDEKLAQAVSDTRERSGRVVAVGTTVVRALESAAVGGQLAPCTGETSLFITPGFAFRVVDAIITNFHLPRSTLLVLVSAFAGRDRVKQAYAHAIAQRYRFFSYGDAMLLEERLTK